jgi:hypothetical protein
MAGLQARRQGLLAVGKGQARHVTTGKPPLLQLPGTGGKGVELQRASRQTHQSVSLPVKKLARCCTSPALWMICGTSAMICRYPAKRCYGAIAQQRLSEGVGFLIAWLRMGASPPREA